MRSLLAVVAAAALPLLASAYTYTVTVTEKRDVPALSIKNAAGSGYSPCTFTFNPAWLDAHPPGLNKSLLIVRASGCPAAFGGAEDHLLAAYCSSDGTCEDLMPSPFPFEADAQDPRVFWNPLDQMYYLYYFANGVGQATVFLRRTATPLDGASWEHVAGPLPWHRNGCVILRPNGLNYVIWGETSAVGIGISTTKDFVSYTTLNSTWLEPYGPTAFPDAPEVVLEAAATPNTLSTGDYLHIYAAGTPGWVANGNYTGGFIILDKNDPTKIIQRGTYHPFMPTMDYEIGNAGPNPRGYPVQRNRTLFVTSLVPVPGEVDTFRAWWGAADANVATGIVTVTYS